jgi:hypothetical protein
MTQKITKPKENIRKMKNVTWRVAFLYSISILIILV